jgi:hypothetical protein
MMARGSWPTGIPTSTDDPATGPTPRRAVSGRAGLSGAGWQRAKRDRRYGLGKYQRFRERVLRRDNWTCFVDGCATFANVLDHVPGLSGDA